MKAIFSGLTDDVSSQVDKWKSAKSLWGRMKNLYGNDPCVAKSDCGSMKNNKVDTCGSIDSRSVSCYSFDKEETHPFMAKETKSEVHTSKCGKADRSHQQDVFGSDDEDEAKVDLESELLNALEELQNVRKDFKRYKDSVHYEWSRLRICLEESNNNISILTSQLEEAKGLIGELKSIFDNKERRYEDLQLEVETKDKERQKMKEEMDNLWKYLEKCKNELKVRN